MTRTLLAAVIIALYFSGGGWYAWRYNRLTTELADAKTALALELARSDTTPRKSQEPSIATPRTVNDTVAEEALRAEIASTEKDIQLMKDRLRSQTFSLDVRDGTTFQNVGTAEPGLAVETLFWGLNGGAVSILENGIIIHPVLQKMVDEAYEGLDESMRQKYNSPENLVANLLATGTAITSMQLTDVKVQKNPNIANVHVRLHYADGGSAEPMLTMIRNGSEWKWAVNEGTLTKFVGILDGKLDITAAKN